MRNDQRALRSLPPGPKVPTLGDVHDVVARSGDLSPIRIRDLTSAITCFCGLIGQEPDGVPLDLVAIREKLAAINPSASGLSAKRLANIRSDLSAAITASKLKPVTLPRQSLTEPWRTLRAMLKTERHRIGISRLSHYATAVSLEPVDVDDGAITMFITAVREQSLHRKPNDLHRKTAVIWNEIARELSTLGLHLVSVPSYRANPRRTDLSLLSNSFKNDMETYLAWCESTDPFAADARPRPLAPATVGLRRDQIHAAVTALVDSGVEPGSITALADLVTAPNFKKIAQRRLETAEGRENSFNRGLATTLVQIAKEWVKTEEATLRELKRLASKLPAPRGDLTAKNKRFLRQFDDPQVLQRLRALPAKLWLQARRDVKANFRTLANAQAALAVEMLIYLPIRLQNLVGLTFEKHLFLQEGRNAVSTLFIPADEVKNKRPIEFDIPPHITRMLIEYRDHIAPRVLGRKPDRLFINPDGTPKASQTLAWLIRRMCRKYAGIEVSPHKFRHLAAKLVLDDSPGAFELVKQLLGHENLKTTANCYAGIDTRRAARHHHRLLRKGAEAIRPVGRTRKRSNPKKKSEKP
jgi:integrase